MTAQDLRWHQRLNSYSKALRQLSKFVEKGELNELEKQGLIHAFEYTFELAWNAVKEYFEAQGETAFHGSRDAFRLGFNRGLLADGDVWMDMIKSRTLTSHTYNEDTAEKIATDILSRYYKEVWGLEATLAEMKDKEE